MITRGDSLQQSFVNKLTVSYLLARDNTERNILASRLILNLFPGIDAATVFAVGAANKCKNEIYQLFKDTESLFPQLYRWAENSESRELRAYSIAMLGAMAMRAEHVHQYRQNNITLIPIALQRLRELHVNF
jgi:3'-phosphoadenosine 5'-phosphosulfate sulfotransferase (PAPS reductase)/FAD synthetase